jgi:transcriptional regulator with XRE-family HTH domain
MTQAIQRKPVKLNLSSRLRVDEKFRHQYFRIRVQNEIASQIRSLRENLGLRQIDLAKRSKMLQSAVSRIEQADYSSWTLKTILRVAEALGARIKLTFEPVEIAIAEYERQEALQESSNRADIALTVFPSWRSNLFPIEIPTNGAPAVLNPASPLASTGALTIDPRCLRLNFDFQGQGTYSSARFSRSRCATTEGV